MNWYTISKKKKKKKKRNHLNWHERSKKVIEPYVFDEQLGLMYQTPNGMAWADLIKEIEKVGSEDGNIIVEAENENQSFDNSTKRRIKQFMQLGIPATVIGIMLSYAPMKENYLIDRSADKWFNAIAEAVESGSPEALSSGPLREVVKKMIREHENTLGPSKDGLYYAYKDGKSVSIGFGFYLGNSDSQSVFQSKLGIGPDDFSEVLNKKRGITPEQADILFDYAFNRAIGIAYRQFSNFENLSPYLQAVIVDMSYNLGEKGISGFKKFRDSLNDGGDLPYDLDRAMYEMKDSKWWDDVGRRSRILQDIVRRYKQNGNKRLSHDDISAVESYYQDYLSSLSSDQELSGQKESPV